MKVKREARKEVSRSNPPQERDPSLMGESSMDLKQRTPLAHSLCCNDPTLNTFSEQLSHVQQQQHYQQPKRKKLFDTSAKAQKTGSTAGVTTASNTTAVTKAAAATTNGKTRAIATTRKRLPNHSCPKRLCGVGLVLLSIVLVGLIPNLLWSALVQSEVSNLEFYPQSSQAPANAQGNTMDFGNGQGCRYDGHCPTGMTCGVPFIFHRHQQRQQKRHGKERESAQDGGLVFPGECIRVPPIRKTSTPSSFTVVGGGDVVTRRRSNTEQQLRQPQDHQKLWQECRQACQVELEMDEHFYHESWPQFVAEKPLSSLFRSSSSTHNMQPWLTLNTTRPRGCVLEFIRSTNVDKVDHWKSLHAKDGTVPINNPEPSIVTWDQIRFRHVVRVDPVLTDDNDDDDNKHRTKQQQAAEPQRWRAYCTAPCQSHDDCQTQSTLQIRDVSQRPWQCVQRVCQRNANYWEITTPHASINLTTGTGRNDHDAEEFLTNDPHHSTTTTTIINTTNALRHPRPSGGVVATTSTSTNTEKMVIVTGASHFYIKGLRTMIASARYWAPNHGVVVYNLGGLGEFAKEIQSWSNVIAMEWFDHGNDGIPREYPPHVHEGKKYAWKPIIIEQAVKRYGMILWMDAGNILMGPIDPIEQIVKRNGIFLVKGQDLDMKPRSHPDTYKWFGLEKDNFPGNRPHFSGNTQAYLYPSRFIKSIVERNAACAWNVSCIAPAESGLWNHRYDQTSLSLCAYHEHVLAPHYTEFLADSNSQVHMESSYRTPSYRIVWTARQRCDLYLDATQNYIDKNVVIKPLPWLSQLSPPNLQQGQRQ